MRFDKGHGTQPTGGLRRRRIMSPKIFSWVLILPTGMADMVPRARAHIFAPWLLSDFFYLGKIRWCEHVSERAESQQEMQFSFWLREDWYTA
jgi:hypothetical protein